MTLSDLRAFSWIWLLLLLLSFSRGILPTSIAGELFTPVPKKPKHILILHSYNSGYEWTRNVNKGFFDQLKDEGFNHALVDLEYMDARRFPQLQDNFIQQIKIKYTGENLPDLIVTSDDLAYELIKARGKEIFGNLPVVFCGLNGYTGKNARYATNATGAMDNPLRFVETIWLIRRLQPKAKKLLILSDHTQTGIGLQSSFRLLSQNGNLGFKAEDIEYLPEMTFAELRQYVRKLTPDTAVLQTIFTKDKTGQYLPVAEVTTMITENCPIPVFTSTGMNLGYGVLGGKISSGYRHGQYAAQTAIRILGGEAPVEIPIANNLDMPYVFDAKQLKKFGISRSELPAESEYINTSPLSELLGGKYRIYTICALILLALQLALIFLLLANRRQLVNTQNLLQHSRRLYMSLVNDPPACVCRCSANGKLTFANRTFSEFFLNREDACRKQGLHMICAEDEQEGFKVFLKGMTQHSPSRFFEHTTIRYDGQIRHLRWIGRAVYDQDGKPHTIQLIGEDITDVRQAYHNLQKEEERFRMVADYTNNWEYWLSCQGEILYISPSCKNFTGFTRDEFFMRPQLLNELVLPEDHEIFHRNSQHQSNLVTFSFRLRQRSGETIWIEQVNQRVHDTAGNDLGRRISNRDITERKKAENALQVSERNLRSIIHTISDALITIDEDGCITNLNRAAEDYCGASLSSTLGKNFSDVFPIVDKETGRAYNDIPDRIFQGAQLPGHIKPTNLLLKSARSRIIAITGARLNIPSTTQTEQSLALIVLRDITRQREIETQLQHAQKMEAIGQLAGGVAHDFNNMLGGIIGAAELLYNMAENKVSDKYTKIIIRTAERAASLTSQLLSFARRSGEMNNVIDIHQIIGEACEILERSIDKRISLITALDASDTMINGDPSQLENAIINLGLNARDSMPEGGKLLIRTENVYLAENFCSRQPQSITPGYYIQVCVSDTGYGIPEEIIDRIFDPFFTTKDVGKGTGLGLAAVYGIMLEHKGTISVLSTPDEGSEFFLLLPVDAQNNPKEADTEEIPHGNGTILLADDEEVILYTAKVLLESCGYNVITAMNGREAIELFRKEKEQIDLVILDMIMPEINGAEAFNKIRAIDPQAKIMICSGYLQDENMQMLNDIGAEHFIRKPYRRAHIMREIFRYMHSDDSLSGESPEN